VPTPDFETFLRERERVSEAYINGNAGPLAAIATSHDPASFMPPSGDVVEDAETVSHAHADGAKAFSQGSTGRFEIVQSGSSGDLAFWTSIQHADVMMKGKDKPASMTLRTTKIFSREDGAWKLIHRHADFGKTAKS
jgi:ketosteroid isomerase-like protein